ncbi:MAG: hypothetical protein QM756_04315 [Polyangiaceae bacterium]
MALSLARERERTTTDTPAQLRNDCLRAVTREPKLSATSVLNTNSSEEQIRPVFQNKLPITLAQSLFNQFCHVEIR